MTDGQTELCESIARERGIMWTTWDIETGPLSDDELRALCPPFDESKVKFGRTKDPDKKQAKVDGARKSHFSDFTADAALCPSTGRVLLVAFCDATKGDVNFMEGDEPDIISSFWEFVRLNKRGSARLAGVNIFDFDLPFLIRRSWIIGLPVPSFVFDPLSKWGNFDPVFVDLRRAWQCGNKMIESNFDHIGRALGTGGKTAGDHGKQFAEVYAKDRKTALEYAANDVRQPAAWLYKMGLVGGQIPDELNPPNEIECETVTEEKESVAHDHEPTLDDI